MAGLGPNWALLLTALEAALKSTPREISANYGPLVGAVDAILDELKSGETMENDTNREKLITLFRDVYAYPHWQLIQTVNFGFGHVLIELSRYGNLAEFVKRNSPILPGLLVANLANEKREIRDAAAQSLGILARELGNHAFDFVSEGLSRISPASPYQTLEGFMVAVGYLASNCAGISDSRLQQALSLALEFADYEVDAAYSLYVRKEALRALRRIFSAKTHTQWRTHIDEQKLKAVIFRRLNDTNIDVRKAAAALHFAWYASLAATTPSIGDSVVQELVAALTTATRWEHRQGLCHALQLFSEDPRCGAAALSPPTADRVYAALAEQIRHTHPESSDKLSVTGSANAMAGRAVVAFFLARTRNAVDDDAVSTYENKLHEPLSHLLASTEPLLLDAGGACLAALLADRRWPRLLRDRYLPQLLCHVFRCRFHGYLPIQYSARRNWDNAVREWSTVSTTPIAALAPLLVESLATYAAASTNGDVRETAFKALEELLVGGMATNMYGGGVVWPDALWIRRSDVLELLVRGGDDQRGGAAAEFARRAAIGALARFAEVYPYAQRERKVQTDSQLHATFENVVFPKFEQWLADDSEMVTTAALRVVAAVAAAGREYPFTENALGPRVAAAVLSHQSHTTEEIKYAAVQAAAALYGRALVDKIDTVVAHAATGLAGRWGLCPDTNEEEEARERAARCLVFLARHAAGTPDQLVRHAEVLLQQAAYGLFADDNVDNDTIVSGSLAMVWAVGYGAVNASQHTSKAVARLAGWIARKLVAMATAPFGAGDTDMEFDVDSLKNLAELPEPFEYVEEEEEEEKEEEEEDAAAKSAKPPAATKEPSKPIAWQRTIVAWHILSETGILSLAESDVRQRISKKMASVRKVLVARGSENVAAAIALATPSAHRTGPILQDAEDAAATIIGNAPSATAISSLCAHLRSGGGIESVARDDLISALTQLAKKPPGNALPNRRTSLVAIEALPLLIGGQSPVEQFRLLSRLLPEDTVAVGAESDNSPAESDAEDPYWWFPHIVPQGELREFSSNYQSAVFQSVVRAARSVWNALEEAPRTEVVKDVLSSILPDNEGDEEDASPMAGAVLLAHVWRRIKPATGISEHIVGVIRDVVQQHLIPTGIAEDVDEERLANSLYWLCVMVTYGCGGTHTSDVANQLVAALLTNNKLFDLSEGKVAVEMANAAAMLCSQAIQQQPQAISASSGILQALADLYGYEPIGEYRSRLRIAMFAVAKHDLVHLPQSRVRKQHVNEGFASKQ